MTILAAASFANYDFQNHRFPIAVAIERVSVSNGIGGNFDSQPNSFSLTISGADVIGSLPMEMDAAQRFLEKRTRYGNVDRQIWIAVTLALAPAGFKDGGGREKTSAATVESAVVFADNAGQQFLFAISKDQITTLRTEAEARKAAAAKEQALRQAEQNRRQMEAERGNTIERLKALPLSVRLANWMSPGPVNFGLSLSNIRVARAQALIRNTPIETIMLVQADKSGRDAITTRWPGHLEITVPKDRPEFKSGNWYLVTGTITTPDGDDFPPAHLAAQTVFACEQEKCTDASDATGIVDRKLAAASQKN